MKINKKTFWAIATVISAASYAIIAKDELKEKNNIINEKNNEISELRTANSDLTYEINTLKGF